MKSMKRARAVTSEFHEATRVLDDAHASKEAKTKAKATLERIGGRDAYQAASALTTTRHRTAKWTFSVLTKMDRRPKRGEKALKTLEVGAINTDLMSAKFLDVRAIDVKSQHPKIEQVDFFDMPVEAESYDVIHSSMVVNCVPTAELRGEMLARTAILLRPKGLFFMMLPLRCVKASTRMSHEKMTRLLRACGLRVIEQKCTPKIIFYCCEKIDKPTEALVGKDLVRRDAREAFAKSARAEDAGGDPSHFGIVLKDEHLCGF
jgi:25S rRNA (adenine2142-N1)-methyltransferase